MSGLYNVEPYCVDLIFTKGDTVNMTFSVTLNAAVYNMNGMQMDIHIKTSNGTIIKDWSSAGDSPAIIISSDTFTIYTTGFTAAGSFKYDVQITDGADVSTIMVGNVIVNKEYTT